MQKPLSANLTKEAAPVAKEAVDLSKKILTYMCTEEPALCSYVIRRVCTIFPPSPPPQSHMSDWLEHQPKVERYRSPPPSSPPIGQQPLQALTLPNLRDELFCQLMRMTENNPSMYVQPTIARNRLHGRKAQASFSQLGGR